MDKKLVLNKIREAYNLESDSEFADFLAISKQTLSNWKARNVYDIEVLYTKCESINPDFLFTGIGEVKRSGELSEFRLRTDSSIDSQSIPLYDIEAAAGIVSLFNSIHDQVNPIDYISIPNLPKCDGAVYVTGDSMYPLLKSGDIVMYKEVQDILNDIFWGEMYLLGIDISGEEHIMVKYIQKSEKDGYVRLVSQNKNHQDKDIKLAKIKALALVKGSIRINSMF